jgi:putative NIF3 family GTP cyclohydrolase 1 type 2
MGCICEHEGITAEALADICKEKLGCPTVRYDKANEGLLKRIAVCSGSGGSFLGEVLAKGCDGYITGDVKHDIFVDAYNAGLVVFDAGHFYTENIFCEHMQGLLKERFPEAEISIARNSGDVVVWHK